MKSKEMKCIICLLGTVMLVALFGCAKQEPIWETLSKPVEMEEGFQTEQLELVGLDAASLVNAVKDIESGKHGEVHSMLIYKDEKLVVEEYFPGYKYEWEQPNFRGTYVDWDHYHTHNIMSAGKSFTSALVAIAIDKGFIESVHAPIFDYLPDHQQFNTDGKENITIEHLLTMTSGLEWDEWSAPYTTEENSIIDLWVNCNDQIACILSHPLVHEPGEHFTYSGGDMILLGEIIERATDIGIDEFMAENLFAPLGIPPAKWPRFDSGIANTSGELYLTPRNMLKFGVLYLNNGKWEEEQIIPPDWVENCKHPYTANNSSWLNTAIWPIPGDDGTFGRRGYAYTWWTHRLFSGGKHVDIFYASGFGGQQIFAIPELDMAIVFTGGNYQQVLPNLKIIRRYILPSIQD